jgi:acyl-coenzyme A thioesterase PaaI-like protein
MTDGAPAAVSDFGISSAAAATGATRHDAARLDEARFALAAAVRRVVSAVVRAPLDEEVLASATAQVEAVAEALDDASGPGRRPRSQPDPTGHPQDFFPTSPAIGFANPLAPPVRVEAVDGVLRGEAWFDYQYEGPPACVHGGVIALVFDEMLGAANIAAGEPGMTGTLTIRYRRPTPLRTPLRLEAKFVERDGRKITTRGGIYEGDELLAEAEGIFIELVPDRFIESVSRHAVTAEVLERIRDDVRRAGGAEPTATPTPTA